MKKKFVLSIFVILLILSASIMSSAEQSNNVSVYLDGETINCSAYGQEATIINGRTLVPLRAIFEALGATVEWNQETRTVSSTLDKTKISLTIGEEYLLKNGERKKIDVPAQIMNGRTLVPARAISEAFGLNVNWHSNFKIVSIIRNKNTKYVVMYDTNYQQHSIENYFVKKYKELGWYDNPDEKIPMYTEGGRIAKVSISNIKKYQANNWYTEPFVWMYADNGKKLEIPPTKIEDYRAVGWYTLDEYISHFLNSGNFESAISFLSNNAYNTISEDTVRIKLNEIYAQTNTPFFATDWSISETVLGTPEVVISLKNLTNKEIVAFEITFTCYDAYGNETSDYSFQNATINAYSDRNEIKPYDTFITNMKLYDNERTQSISTPKVTKVAFSDGTVWSK